MQNIDSVNELIASASKFDWDSAIFTDLAAWNKNPFSAPIYILEGDDELEDLVDGPGHLPKLAHRLNVKQLLDMQTFQSVVEFQLEKNANSTVEEVLYAINYYREFDDFYEP